MDVQYQVRFEGDDLVCFLVAGGTDWAEIHRVPAACEGEPDCDEATDRCMEQIDRCQLMAEDDWGAALPWAWPENDDDPRVCWTGPLVRQTSVMIGLI